MDAMTLLLTLSFVAGAPSTPCSFTAVPTNGLEKIVLMTCAYDVAASPDGFDPGLVKLESDAGADCHQTAITDPSKHQIAILACAFETLPEGKEAKTFAEGYGEGKKTAPAPDPVPEANP